MGHSRHCPVELVAHPDAARAHETETVETKGIGGGSPNGGSTDHASEARTPAKVIFPVVRARVEEANDVTCTPIANFGASLLVVIAPEAAEAEVLEIARAAFGFGDDMVNRELVSGVVHKRMAVLTQAPRSLADAPPKRR